MANRDKSRHHFTSGGHDERPEQVSKKMNEELSEAEAFALEGKSARAAEIESLVRKEFERRRSCECKVLPLVIDEKCPIHGRQDA